MRGTFGRSGIAATVLLALGAAAPGIGEAIAEEGSVAEMMKEGEGLFLVNCRQCHGTKGTAGTPLANNAKLEDPVYIGKTIITGPGYMTAFADHLDDEQIALIATFIRNSWGNEYGPVTADEIAAAR